MIDNTNEETLLTRAKGNLEVAKVLIEHDNGDDVFCNFIAYHLQQALELSIKYQMEQEGIHYPHDHDIETLCTRMEEHDVSPCVTDYVRDHSDMFTLWEAKTRYILDYKVQQTRITRALPEIEKSIALCEEAYQKEWTPEIDSGLNDRNENDSHDGQFERIKLDVHKGHIVPKGPSIDNMLKAAVSECESDVQHAKKNREDPDHTIPSSNNGKGHDDEPSL